MTIKFLPEVYLYQNQKLIVLATTMKQSSVKLQNTLQLQYIQFLRSFLRFVGGWPSNCLRDLGEPKQHPFAIFPKIELPILYIVIFFVEFNFLGKYFKDLPFTDKGLMYININICFLTWFRLVLVRAKSYANIIKDFLTRNHLFNYRRQSAFSGEIYKKIDKFCLFFSYYSMGLMVLGLILYNVMPMYTNYKNGVFLAKKGEPVKLEFSVIYEFPGHSMNENFKLFTVLNWYLSINCSILFCGPDALLSLMIFHMIGHIKILQHELKNIPKPKRQQTVEFLNNKGEGCQAPLEMYDREENEYIRKKLSECIEYHKFIVSAMKDISEVFGLVQGFTYGIDLVLCCVLLLECSQNDPVAILRFGPLTVIVFFQLVQMSVTFEYVGTVSEKLDSMVYLTPWECMDSRNRRTVCILLQRVQTPIHVTAMGLTPIGVTTMSKIIKTTFSYFTFLKSIV